MKIFAVGMNYAQHNKEIKTSLFQQGVSTADDDRQREPIIFTKADSSLLKDGKPFFVPDFMGRIDYETEVVVRICKLGKSIDEKFAHRYYDAVTLGIDFTARDMQKRLREEGQPWEIAKGFDGSAVIGEWIEKEKLYSPDRVWENEGIQALHFSMEMNGETKQEGCTSDMLCSVDRLIAYISQFFTLKTGDLLFTGTPVGVGPVKPDDHIVGFLEGRKVLDFYCR
ncbi:MAG: fumarylacetoacetate hydrolase family protein [Prevotella sp.]|nr:fumarylacetoacetate hydrolase family protein [Prevotella sp.]MBP3750383.1 fumarylacetoacetate hydrolase family protein [Prevotella sp.]